MKSDYLGFWAEYWTFVLLVVGFLVGITLNNMWLNYLVIFIAGMMGGRLMYQRKTSTKFTHFLITIGFLAGFLIGSYAANKKVIIILFLIGGFVSFWLHKEGIIDRFIPVRDPQRQNWK